MLQPWIKKFMDGYNRLTRFLPKIPVNRHILPRKRDGLDFRKGGNGKQFPYAQTRGQFWLKQPGFYDTITVLFAGIGFKIVSSSLRERNLYDSRNCT